MYFHKKVGCAAHMGGPRSRAAAALALAALLSAGALRAATETVGGRTWTYRAAGGAAEVVPAGGGRCAVSPAPSGRLAVPATLGASRSRASARLRSGTAPGLRTWRSRPP